MSRIQLFGIVSGLLLLVFVLELVRRRRLREEYAWLWLITALGQLTLSVFPKLQLWVANLLGSDRPISTFILFGFLYLVLICIQFSMRLSRLTDRNKHLAQQVAILDSELRELRTRAHLDPGFGFNGDSGSPTKVQPLEVQEQSQYTPTPM
jgi:hypothetical protein